MALLGIGAQTAFLVLADFTLKKVNLEHAASSLANLLQSTLLMIMLTFPILAYALPNWTLLSVHPVSLVLAGSDLFYRGGSLYHQFTSQHLVLLTIVLIMSGVLLLGLLRRQKRGPANIGFEGVAVRLLYAFLVAYTLF